MRGTRLLVFLLFVVVAVVAAVLVVRAVGDDGGSGNPDAAAWADSVCTSVSDWKSTITSLADVSGGGLSKDSLRQKLDDADAATDRLVTELRDLGAPDLDAGDAVKQKLDDDADVLQSSYESLKSKAQDALDASSTTGFLSALAQLGPPFQALLDRISTTITDLQNADVSQDAKAELRQAFDDADSCQALRSED